MDMYSSPLATPGAPPENGIYATAAERAKAANQQFQAVADKYSWLPEGTKAHYFAGVTDAELGRTGPAETELKSRCRFVGSQSREPCQAGSGRSVSPDESRRPGHRPLQRDRGQAVGDGLGRQWRSWTWPTSTLLQASGTWRGFCGPR